VEFDSAIRRPFTTRYVYTLLPADGVPDNPISYVIVIGIEPVVEFVKTPFKYVRPVEIDVVLSVSTFSN
jgi:hypothetical protein